MKNAIICLVCSLFTVSAIAYASYELKTKTAKNGAVLISIHNKTKYSAYCFIETDTYFVDFTVGPNKRSRWYAEPQGDYEWGCE